MYIVYMYTMYVCMCLVMFVVMRGTLAQFLRCRNNNFHVCFACHICCTCTAVLAIIMRLMHIYYSAYMYMYMSVYNNYVQ